MSVQRFSRMDNYGVLSARKKIPAPQATGGSVETQGGYTVHLFTEPGDHELFFSQKPTFIDYLVVAGGGGAGGAQNSASKGGDAGNVLTGAIGVSREANPVKVGVAGTKGPGWSTSSGAQPGGDSAFSDAVSAVGGKSSPNTWCCPTQYYGGNGGSCLSCTGVTGGTDAPGPGIVSSITGSQTEYGRSFAAGAINYNPPDRPDNSGDGGQAVWSNASRAGGQGGSGLVVIRYLNEETYVYD